MWRHRLCPSDLAIIIPKNGGLTLALLWVAVALALLPDVARSRVDVKPCAEPVRLRERQQYSLCLRDRRPERVA